MQILIEDHGDTPVISLKLKDYRIKLEHSILKLAATYNRNVSYGSVDYNITTPIFTDAISKV